GARAGSRRWRSGRGGAVAEGARDLAVSIAVGIALRRRERRRRRGRSRGGPREPGDPLLDLGPVGGVRGLAQVVAVALGRVGRLSGLLLGLPDPDQERGIASD